MWPNPRGELLLSGNIYRFFPSIFFTKQGFRKYQSPYLPHKRKCASVAVESRKKVASVRLFLKEMDTSNPAVFVNMELLKMHVGRRVRAVIQVLRSDGGGTVVGNSSDEQQLVIKGHPPGPLSTFVEVIGIADSNQSIRAEIWTNFGDNLDTASYNQVCNLANGDYKHLFI